MGSQQNLCGSISIPKSFRHASLFEVPSAVNQPAYMKYVDQIYWNKHMMCYLLLNAITIYSPNQNIDKPPIGMNAYQTIFALFSLLLMHHAKLCSLNQTFVTARAQSRHSKKPGHMSFHIKILSSAHQGETRVPLWY